MSSQVTLQGLQPYLSYLGSFMQFGSALLLIALFGLLRPYARRRKYFITWSYGWIALSLALAALTIRNNILIILPDGPPTDDSLGMRLLFFTYQFGKVAFYGLLIAGTLKYVRQGRPLPTARGFLIFAGIYAAFSISQAAGLGEVVVWQAPVAVAMLGYSAFMMLRLPVSRRSVGSRLAGSCFAFGAAVWLTYLAAFTLRDGPGGNPIDAIVHYNTYLDLLWHVSLAFGMVVLLMEDVKRQVDAAHSELNIAHNNLRRSTLFDSVTGSLNRQAFSEGLGLDVARAGFGAVVVMDLDDLKDINDMHGHATGDRMLRYLVDVLRADLRTADKLFRWGGDEFMIILPGGDADHVCRRMKAILAEAPPLSHPSGTGLKLNVSVGAAAYTGTEDLHAAIDEADRAMYADKLSRKAAFTAQVDVAQSA